MTERKRVLILIKGLDRGGAEQLLVNAAPHGDTSRFEYEVAYVLPERKALVGALEQRGLRVHCLGSRGWMARLRRLVRERGIDLIHVHSPVPAVGARLGLVGRGLRIVTTEHNVWQSYHPATYWANLLTFPLNDHVFGVSDCVSRSIRYPGPLRRLRMPPLETLHHGLDCSATSPQDRGVHIRRELGIPEGFPVVGSVANFKEQKGHTYLLEAAVAVRRTVPEARFVLVGAGPLEADIRRRAAEMDLGETVVFAGYRQDATAVMGIFDVFVLSSIHEGLSIALLEAMALGIAPVVTEVGGLPEVVTNAVDGLIVPPRDAHALAEALVSVLTDASLRGQLAEASRHRAASFDIRKAVHRMEAVYEELLA
jgi:glycosyltransferase involved in cell wall biosynthesis